MNNLMGKHFCCGKLKFTTTYGLCLALFVVGFSPTDKASLCVGSNHQLSYKKEVWQKPTSYLFNGGEGGI